MLCCRIQQQVMNSSVVFFRILNEYFNQRFMYFAVIASGLPDVRPQAGAWQCCCQEHLNWPRPLSPGVRAGCGIWRTQNGFCKCAEGSRGASQMAGSREDCDAAQYRQERRVRAGLWPRKGNTCKITRMCCFVINVISFCDCMIISFYRKIIWM